MRFKSTVFELSVIACKRNATTDNTTTVDLKREKPLSARAEP